MYSSRAHHCVLGICIVKHSLQIMSNTIGSMSNHYFGLCRITLTSKEPTRFFHVKLSKYQPGSNWEHKEEFKRRWNKIFLYLILISLITIECIKSLELHLTGQSATKSLKEEWSKCKARIISCFFGMQKKKKLLIVTCAILLRMKLDLDSWWWRFLYFPCVICQDIYNLWSAKLCFQDCKDIVCS